MSSFSYIKPQNTLYKDYKMAKVQKQILCKATDLPAEIRNKHSMELLKMICNCVEASINNKGKKDKMKIDKRLLVIQIFNGLFANLTPVDLDTISKNIEYLHDNNEIIKYSFFYVATSTAWNWLKSKL